MEPREDHAKERSKQTGEEEGVRRAAVKKQRLCFGEERIREDVKVGKGAEERAPEWGFGTGLASGHGFTYGRTERNLRERIHTVDNLRDRRGNGSKRLLYGGTDTWSHASFIRSERTRYDSMSDRIVCHVENVRVRSDRRETLEDLLYTLFERRHHSYVAGQEHDWLTVELVQSLRRESDVYREELSSEMAGPLPFAVGYFQLQEGALRLTTNEIPANVPPETLVRFLSEFVEPGARLWFGTGEEQEGWEVCGVDDLESLASSSD